MSSRKLQQEFEKLQKKVTEGLQSFEEIYEKIGVTENPSLKEKLEGDLRKEIKKLQRSRDQVKQWSSDSSNKLDKSVLLDTRSRIENAMERFKEVEKVSKMKQFSNEGLELQTKLGARGLDEAKKNDASKYIVEVLDELNRQNELLQGESAHFSHKKKSAAAQSALADITMKVERNNSHILRLELVLRNLENYQLEPEKIDEIRDDLDYYVENNQSSDFVEYDEFYDLLELSEPVDNVATLTHAPVQSQAPESAAQTQPQTQTQIQNSAHASQATPSPKKAANAAVTDSKAGEKKSTDHKAGSDTPSHPRVTITIGNSINNTSGHSAPATAPSGSAASSGAAPMSAPAAASSGASHSAAVSAASGGAKPGPASSRAPPPGLNPQSSKPATPVKMTVAEELKKKAMTHAAAAASAIKSPAQKPAFAAAAAAAVAGQEQAASSTGATAHVGATPSPSPSPVQATSRRDFVLPFWDNSANVAALAQSRLQNPLPLSAISQQLEASLLNCPDSFDSERSRQYNPTNVHPSSVDYPQEPMFELNSATIMKKFDTDTLFFCFYYNENQDALAKWNAARELSRRGWVFNSATKQWFSKEDKPKSRSILGGLQNGKREENAASFKYFDYENSWLVRRKDNFEFDSDLQRTF